jgi:glycosyltransferase involved in cell wall biosynthesis
MRESPSEAAVLPEVAISAESPPTPGRNKILYVVGSLDVGGTERHLALLAPGLKRMGWDPTIYCLTRPGEQASEVRQAGVPVLSAPFPIISGQRWFATRALKLALSSLKLLWVMLSTRPQIAHFFLPVAYLLGAPSAILGRIPILVMSRRSLNRYQARHPLLSRLELWLHSRMTAILGNSRQVVRELVSEGCPPERVALIYNGIDYNGIDASSFEADPLPASTQGEAAHLTLITVANLIPYKGHSDLLTALAQIAQALPRDWTLLCVGNDSGLGASLKQQARTLGIEKNVNLIGASANVAALLARADIGVLASHEEGFSNSILEGMAAGLPMVVTGVGGNAEAVIDGVTGLVVQSRDADALGGAILKLANDARLRQNMGEAGRKRVERYFTIDRCIAGYLRFYAGLLKGESPADIVGLDRISPD